MFPWVFNLADVMLVVGMAFLLTHLLRDEYRIKQVTKRAADSIDKLADMLAEEGVDREGFLKTIAAYNAAVRTDIAFDPNVKDGRRTEGLAVPKSNWANTIDTPPFEAYAVTCGITFTFGGLRIDGHGRVLDQADRPHGNLPRVLLLPTVAMPPNAAFFRITRPVSGGRKARVPSLSAVANRPTEPLDRVGALWGHI